MHELRVRYGECDPQQIVFNANYFLYFDVAFTELWREAIGPWQDMVERGIDAVVAEANARFRAPARFDDVLSLRAQVTRLGTTSVTTQIDVMRDDELLVEGRLQHVCVDAQTWKKTELPDWVRVGPAAVRGCRSRMAKKRKRRAEPAPAATVDYTDADGNVLTLRESVSAGTVAKLAERAGRRGGVGRRHVAPPHRAAVRALCRALGDRGPAARQAEGAARALPHGRPGHAALGARDDRRRTSRGTSRSC